MSDFLILSKISLLRKVNAIPREP